VRHTFAADDSNPRDIWRSNDSPEMKARQSSDAIFRTVFFAAVFFLAVMTGAAAEKGAILTGKEAMGDWTSDAPGVIRKITVQDLPPPGSNALAINRACVSITVPAPTLDDLGASDFYLYTNLPGARLCDLCSRPHLLKQKGVVMLISNTIADLRQQIHDDLRRQHPEWVLPEGESPMCDAYEARLMDLLGVQPTDDARPKGNASEMRSTQRLPLRGRTS